MELMETNVSKDGTGPLVELRRYTLHPGARETLIELFDRAFIETQEICGIRVLGQFRDIDDPDAFVWLRSFPNMERRAKALSAFYGGPVWAENRDDANSTMVNSDDVLLLNPSEGAYLGGQTRVSRDAELGPGGLFVCTIHHLKPGGDDEFASFFASVMQPELQRCGPIEFIANFKTERSANTFPKLPVREGETVFVWLARYRDLAGYATQVGRLAQSTNWTKAILPDMRRRTWRKDNVARLVPTSRSELR